jgi:hypothetical protein
MMKKMVFRGMSLLLFVLTFMMIQPQPVSAAVNYWYPETILSKNTLGEPEMDYDAAGNPGIVYADYRTVSAGAKFELMYAYKDSTGWHQEIVAGNGYYRSPSLEFDAAGKACISFYSETSLVYGVRISAGNWQISAVDSYADAGFYGSSLKFNNLGKPCIAYENVNNQIRFASFNGSVWGIQTAAEYESDAGYASLDFINGKASIAYSQGDGLFLRTWNGSSWVRETVDPLKSTTNLRNRQADITLQYDASGKPFISYLDDDIDDLKVAVRNGSTWSLKPLNRV